MFESVFVERHPEDERLRTVDLRLEGVTCAACVWLVEKLPEVLPGVMEARLSLGRSTVRVTWDATRVRLSEVARALDRFGTRCIRRAGVSGSRPTGGSFAGG